MRIILLILLITSCTKKKYSKDECELLSMAAYKGLPKEANLFKENCINKYVDFQYSAQRCQLALKDLILGIKANELKSKHGDKILNCFSKNDLENFLKPKQ